MSRWSDQVRDEYSRPVPHVSIYVYKWDALAQAAGDLETLTDDTSAPIANPVETDDDGIYYFNSLDGQKLLELHYGGKVQERELILVGALPVPQATFGGLFINAAALTIPVGMDMITTTGHSALDVGAAVYVYDIAVDSAYVTAHPYSSFISLNGRGFRLSTEQEITPLMFGADSNDIGLGIQRAIDAGHDDIVLRGQNWLRSGVVSDRVIRLSGNGWEESATPGEGTWLKIESAGFNPFTYTGTAAKGFQMQGIAFWQSHPAVGVGWTPSDYPPVITITDLAGGCYLDQIFFANINKWVSSVGAGRTSWGRIVGMPLRYGFSIDNALDACHGGTIHAWPYGYASDPDYGVYVGAWTSANADLFILGRVDSPQMGDIFALGCRSVFRITETASGIPSKISGGTINADNCKYVFYDPDGVGAPDGAQGWDFSFSIIQHEALKPGITPAEPIDGARFIYSTSDFVNGQVGTYFGEWHDRHDVEASGASFSLQIGNYKSDDGNQDNGGYGRFLLTGTNALVQIGRVDLQGTPVGPLNDPSSTQNIEFAGNVVVLPGDYHNEVRINQGGAAIAIGNSSIVVSHGLTVTPTINDIQLTPLSNLGGSSVTYFWVSNVTSTQFTINVNANVATIGINFAWLAQVPGA